jgi:hypothetical protein
VEFTIQLAGRVGRVLKECGIIAWAIGTGHGPEEQTGALSDELDLTREEVQVGVDTGVKPELNSAENSNRRECAMLTLARRR